MRTPTLALVSSLLLVLAGATAACRGPSGPIDAATVSVPAPLASAASPASATPPPPATSPSPSASSGPTSGASDADAGAGLGDNRSCTLRKNSGTIASCEKVTKNLGGWTPTAAEVADAVKHSSGLCSCAADVPAGVLACAKRARSATLKVQLGKEDEPMDCTVNVSAVAWGQRRWIVLFAGNRDEATFFVVTSIQERTASGFVTYFEGSAIMPSDEEIQKGVEGVSPAMARDWPKLPASVKKALGAS
jgi:hypothetical protein